MDRFNNEIKGGRRFTFGKNWKAYVNKVTDERIAIAEESIKSMLSVDRLDEKKFLDIGSGSGLFSLAARRLGADVYSFDYDPTSVATTEQLKNRYYYGDPKWRIEKGSVLDEGFIDSLGRYDIVYSWGVLHHTGNMWKALENVISVVKKQGSLYIALYNDQGIVSRFWWHVKKLYCSSIFGKGIVSLLFIPCFFLKTVLACIVIQKNIFKEYKQKRGMSVYHDWVDWLGGFPFEAAKVKDVTEFFKNRGFELTKVTTKKGLGNNQFVFIKN